MSDQTLSQLVEDEVRSLAEAAAGKAKIFGAGELDYWKLLAIGILWQGCQGALKNSGTPAADAWISGLAEEFAGHAARMELGVELRTTRRRKRN